MAGLYCSWSGGKDCAAALHEVWRREDPALLLTMLTEDGERSRSHGLHRDVLVRQAEAIGVPIRFAASSWSEYAQALLGLVRGAAQDGFTTGVFGDLDVEGHREWQQRLAREAGTTALLPLWKRDTTGHARSVVDQGFRAMIVAVKDKMVPLDLLGRVMDEQVVAELQAAGVDPSGEYGEFHTVVVDGPLFGRPLVLEQGERTLRSGMWFLDVR
ncbi:Dph6-related ATP pyrophosphatase [Ornithinimicrobium avium]|nr:diphthine--ammonia ligase [Ornithinimicrobium avium]